MVARVSPSRKALPGCNGLFIFCCNSAATFCIVLRSHKLVYCTLGPWPLLCGARRLCDVLFYFIFISCFCSFAKPVQYAEEVSKLMRNNSVNKNQKERERERTTSTKVHKHRQRWLLGQGLGTGAGRTEGATSVPGQRASNRLD